MGSFVSAIRETFYHLGGATKRKVLMLGLDAAGKTTVLYRFKLRAPVHTIPTIGFNVEEVPLQNTTFCIWDISGRAAMWHHYYQDMTGIIFVVDSADTTRFEEAREKLQKVLAVECLRNAPLLVFANKQDLPKAVSTADISEELGLSSIHDREWHIQACCAPSGDGIDEGMAWLSKTEFVIRWSQLEHST